jgi:hypothetical protein
MIGFTAGIMCTWEGVLGYVKKPNAVFLNGTYLLSYYRAFTLGLTKYVTLVTQTTQMCYSTHLINLVEDLQA